MLTSISFSLNKEKIQSSPTSSSEMPLKKKPDLLEKADILSDIERKAKQNGIVAIAGGLRGGKSSLLKVTSSHLIDAGNAQSSSAIYCASFSRKDKVAEMARDITDDRKRKNR